MAKPARQARQTTAAARARAALDGGASPLEVQLATMRALWRAACDEEGAVVDHAMARAAAAIAKDVAPYVHPRLTAVEHGREEDAPRHEDVLDALA